MSLAWKSLIINNEVGITDTYKNALFYSDKVSILNCNIIIDLIIWTPIFTSDTTGLTKEEFFSYNFKKAKNYFLTNDDRQIITQKYLFESLTRIQDFFRLGKKLKAIGFDVDHNTHTFSTYVDVRKGMSGHFKEFENLIDEFFALIKSEKEDPLLKLTNKLVKEIFPVILNEALEKTTSFFNETNSESLKYLGLSYWKPHKAVDELICSLRKTQILPDISNLPIEDLFDLKIRMKDSFDPMRAELLRMSKELRGMINEGISPENIAREATNLINTNIEPCARELKKQAESELKLRYKKHLKNVIYFIGLAGVGVINPATLIAAITFGLKTLIDLAGDKMKYEPSSDTVSFAIEMTRKMPIYK